MTSFLGRGPQKFDMLRYEGGRGQKRPKKVRRLLWTAPNSYFAIIRKMECVSKINLFGLQMMVKSGLDIIILKFFHAQNYFCYFIKMTKIASSLIKITFFAHGGISMKLFVMYLNMINQTLKQRIPPIFHFEYVNKV